MAKAYEQIGAVDCHSCGKSAPLKKQKNGLAAYTCSWCGFQGTSHYEESSEHLKKRAGLTEAMESEPKPTAEKPPAAEQETAPPPPKPVKQNIWGIPE